MRHLPRSRKCQFRTRAPQQISSRTFPVVRFVYLSVECPFDKFYGINCRLKLGAKLLYRFFHRRRQISPTVNNLTHRFFDSSQHSLYCNFTVGSRHSAAASSSSSKRQQNSSSAGLPRQYHRTKGTKPQFPNGAVSSVSFVSTTNTTRSLASFVLPASHLLATGGGKRITRRATPRRLPSSSAGSRRTSLAPSHSHCDRPCAHRWGLHRKSALARG